MISQRIANLIFAGFMLVAVSVMAWIAWGFTTPPLGDATLPTKFFPLVLLGFIAISILIYGREYIIHGQSGGDAGEAVFKDSNQLRTGLLTIATTIISYVVWREFGFLPAGALATLAVSFAMGTRKIAHFAIIIAGALATYLVFTYGLGTQFH